VSVPTVHAESIGGRVTEIRRNKGRRICAEDGCTTVLSVYNRGKKCSLHQEPEAIRTRGHTF
jgi:hypothetical protein